MFHLLLETIARYVYKYRNFLRFKLITLYSKRSHITLYATKAEKTIYFPIQSNPSQTKKKMKMKNKKDLTRNERISIDLISEPDQIFKRKKKGHQHQHQHQHQHCFMLSQMNFSYF